MLDVLKSIVEEVNSTESFRDVLNLIVHRVRASMGTGICSVYLYDAVDDSYVLRATEGLTPESVGTIRLKKGEGLVGLVAARAEPVNLEFADQHPNFAFFPETGEEKFRSFLGAPIIHQREVLGVLIVQQVNGRRFDQSEEAFLVTISAQLATAIAHAKATGEFATLSLPPGQLENAERIFSGIASAPGVAIGQGVVISQTTDLKAVPRRPAKDISEELSKFKQAINKTRQDIERLEEDFSDKLSQEEHALFDVYIRMLDDHSLGGEVVRKIKDGLSAQSAWSQIILEHVKLFRSMDDEYLSARAEDVADLGRRVLANLQKSNTGPVDYPDNTVLIGEELSAATFTEVPIEKVVALVSLKGSANSHLAIIGRALGIPTIMGAVDLPWTKLDGQDIIVDGNQGKIISCPGWDLFQAYEAQYQAQRSLADDLEWLRNEPCITADDCPLTLWINTGLRVDALMSSDQGAEGVGLYRTEIPYLMLDRFPSEEEQRRIYREQLELFSPRPVTMRSLDIGGDKALPYFPIVEANPFLGWRGIRITLDHPEIFLLQIRAMMRASEGLNNLRILLPMITNIDELTSSIKLVQQAFNELTEEEGLPLVRPELGVMIEVPAAVYQVRAIAEHVDFLSVGTNDLTQYLLAVDRNNPRVAGLYQSFHPAILRALSEIAKGAQEKGKPVSVCGEMAGDPLGSVILVALGYRVLSMSSVSLLKVKAMLRNIEVKKAEEVLAEAMELQCPDEVKALFAKAFTNDYTARLLDTGLVATDHH